MAEITNSTSCANVDGLVAYLYGETNESEAGDFQNHLKACDDCRSELAAFGNVRESIETWRNEALNQLPASNLAIEGAKIQSHLGAIPRRSALAAIREFFALSPMWLRGATAFAALLFVALLVITTMHFIERPEALVANDTRPVAPPSESKTGVTSDKHNSTMTVTSVDNPTSIEHGNEPLPRTNSNKGANSSRANSNRRPNVPVLSNEERSQLSDLLIAENEKEESVPRLYDLLNESN